MGGWVKNTSELAPWREMVHLHKYLLKFCFRNSKQLHILRLQYKDDNKAMSNLANSDSLLAFQ